MNQIEAILLLITSCAVKLLIMTQLGLSYFYLTILRNTYKIYIIYKFKMIKKHIYIKVFTAVLLVLLCSNCHQCFRIVNVTVTDCSKTVCRHLLTLFKQFLFWLKPIKIAFDVLKYVKTLLISKYIYLKFF